MSGATLASGLRSELAAIAGEANVVDDPRSLAAFAIDGVPPQVAVTPRSVEETAAVLKLASAQRLTVAPAGGFTHQHIGAIPAPIDILLRTTRLDGFEHYDPGDLTIGVGAGTTLAGLQQKLAGHGQMLPLEVARPETSTVGGALSVAAHGPLRHRYGGVRDFCIGVRFITGDGVAAKAGGRVVKNVAGYDVMKLLIGSYGTLGVIVGANFKVFPQPRPTRTFVAKFLFANGAIQYRDRVLRSALTPLGLELVSPRASEFLSRPENTWNLYVRAAGSDVVLARYRAELGNYVKEELEDGAASALWLALARFDEAVHARHANAMLVQLSVPMEWVAQAINFAEELAGAHNFFCAHIGRIGLGSLLMAFIPIGAPSAMQYANAISAYRAALPPDASCVVTRCPLESKARVNVWGSTPTDLAAMRAVKQALDPADILNRGRFLL